MNHVDHPFQSPVVLSLCPGILGLERALERVIGPLRIAAYCEREAFICENLVAGMEAGLLAPAPIWSDLKTFPWRFFRGKVDLLMGGYPCQPFSNAGLGLGTIDPRHLWPYIEGGIYTIRPLCCFFENVAAHLNKGYREVKWSLEKMGYIVKEGIFSAEEVGAPHLRERLFILAILGNAGRPSWWPDYSGGNGRDKNRLFGKGSESSDRSQCAGEELAYTYSDRHGATTSHIGCPSCDNEGAAQGQGRERLRGFIRDSNPALGDTSGDDERRQWSGERGRQESIGRSSRWPAPPGEGQYDWEHPRTIESGMGCTINGYNFREDLLRALGNSVIEQQAEYAFRDLIRKHLSHSQCPTLIP